MPRPQFKPYFDRAIAAGLHSVPHAGETTGPGTVWDALIHLGAERIGHGTTSAQDPKLLAHLAEHRIPLEVCPTSNIATRAVKTLDEHPIRQFVDAGVVVTVNSDDPPMFGTDLNTEYAVAARLLDLDERGVAALARNAVEASFLDEPAKARTRRGDRHLPATRGSLGRDRLTTMGAMRTVTAVAHRGDPYRVRENTLASLRSALERGADAVEIDVRLTRDGVPVLLHDSTLKRLWDHDRPLAALSSDEVRGSPAGGVPTLAEALEATGRAGG